MAEQWDTAAKLLGLAKGAFSGGVEYCELTVAQLTRLLEIGFVSLSYKFNQSPTVETFYEFGKRAEECGATVVYEGFLESKARENAKLVIDGVKVKNFSGSSELVLDFSQTFHDADEFTAKTGLLRAWYD